MSLHVKPITIKAAKAANLAWHRKLKKCGKHLWAVSVVDETGALRGVAIVALPIARLDDDGWTCEVVRVATDGARNACSMLYGICRRTAQQMGYRRCLTKTLEAEGGASLRAVGVEPLGLTRRDVWDRPSRKRGAPVLPDRKVRWDLMSGGRR